METMRFAGLVRKTDLAMAYFPHATSPKVARDNLVRWINRCRPLCAALEQTHYNRHGWYFTPRQTRLILEYLGGPYPE